MLSEHQTNVCLVNHLSETRAEKGERKTTEWNERGGVCETQRRDSEG